ncbi:MULTISPECIES: DUF484 family protein [Marinimicrobium]|jgi:hypothetical protein|uniref:DUF484 family protein n=1 Tax=Marinimicrobium koreense TaxID=306545 RepID=A0A3N1PAT9_9GAMM|nr:MULTISPECIES: DUF484 family protein [Marinimicrobium]MAN52467.1 hypothetical protein [Marinimicrobium sp.]ROQ21766.1 hypothetical protein EDC38_2394 [Marinimicrobium koreense]
MSEQSTEASQLTDEQVAQYLEAHPDFFVQHRKLLADLELPHESGPAVSLVERQVSVLRERNMDMRHRLSKLLDNARENDKLFDKTKRLVLALLEGRDMGDIIDALCFSFDQDFNIHYTSILLFGHEDRVPSSQARVVTIGEARQHIAPLLKNNRAMCGTLGEGELQFLFGDNAHQIGSVATVPLVHGNAYGLLAIGNRDPHYYRSSMGTLFLGYIAEVLNRLLPEHLPR